MILFNASVFLLPANIQSQNPLCQVFYKKNWFFNVKVENEN